MNRENLQRMADHIRTVPQELFNMEFYRSGDCKKPKCGSVGCVIGHCTILDENPLPRIAYSNEIDFTVWSEMFTGIEDYQDEWNWCFSSGWADYRTDNTPEGAALRIEWLLNHGLPNDWEYQMCGMADLCYIPKNELPC